MKKLAIILVMISLATAADAQSLLMGVYGRAVHNRAGAATGGGGGGACTNSLDFSQACNSQFVGVVL